MYSSVSEADYQFRRAKAEREARAAYDRSAQRTASDPTASSEHPAEDSSLPAGSGGVHSSLFGGRIGNFLSRLKDDDLLILGLLFLLFNENKEDDPLILIILAALLFT